MTDIEILQIGSREYVSFEDAARYLGCSVEQVKDFIYLDKICAERFESRWLVQWQTVQAFAKKRGQNRRTE